MTIEPVYRIIDFRFKYPDSNCEISWLGEHNIYPGERILLTGASGSGKSTLLYGLMGLIPETVYGEVLGDILFKGNSIIKDPELIRGKAGLILQNPSAQMLCRTVREELAYGLENQEKPVDEIISTINEWAERFDIKPLLDRETLTLSGGEKQKVTLLSILMTSPEILMLDEPTAFLDPQTAREIMQIISEFQENKTLIFVEHNQHFLKALITRNLYLQKNGKVNDQLAEKVNWHSDLPHLTASHLGKSIIKFKDIRFSYDDNKLLGGINLEISEREIVSIRGRNGCGKSTLLRIMSGLGKDFQGDILLEDNTSIFNDMKALRNIVGLLFQNPENHFLFNRVEQELENNCIGYITEEFSAKAEQSPFTLSEGEKRRLSTAISYRQNIKLLLLDEPTFGQDNENKIRLIELLGNLRDTGLGIVIVSHDEEFIKAVSSRIFELKSGKLVLGKEIETAE